MRTFAPVLFQPYPAYAHPKRQILQCIITGFTVFVMLYFLKPFNLNLVNEMVRREYALIYALIAFAATMAFTVALPFLVPKWYDEQHWLVYKEILNIIALLLAIALANMTVQHKLDGDQISLGNFGKTISYMLPIAALPICIAIVCKQRILYRKYQLASAAMNTLLQQKQDVGPIDSRLVLTGTNDGEVLELETDAFRYISAEDNYVKVFWIDQQVQKSRILRNTLRNIEEKTIPFKQISRCHRGYIVNLGKLEKVIGDAQGLKIRLKDIPEDIPVGKKYLDAIRDKAARSS